MPWQGYRWRSALANPCSRAWNESRYVAGCKQDGNVRVRVAHLHPLNGIESLSLFHERSFHMFTGIVEETGAIESIHRMPAGIRLAVRARVCARDTKAGDSIAVNGCCLTVAKIARSRQQALLHFDLLRETWTRTNLQFAAAGDLVNLERSLAADGRVGGHFVSGHIDGIGKITRWERAGGDHVLDIAAPRDVLRYAVFKGSIAVDGISLTVAAVTKKSFRLWIIPHTFEVTALRERRVGNAVNLEADILGKYVERFIAGTGKRES
jgi:riboflavin synthase